ncbi:voltage-gated clc-type chloride channel, putative [Ricinus communis]|uniref:Voltage-gated clc-type chloride channel, putative n=1 Tax=Ricinus communis TaxID=3988 RepID=B9TGK6_RICCO|nr:voltage-gated clc-type chloride channel, putative [Ricinus communis]
MLHVDPRLAALVGTAAIFAGASRAFLAAVVFAFETTQQVHGLLPLLGACAAAYLVSGLMMRNTIMTEKIIRRGVRVPSDYSADYLDRIAVGDICTREVVTLQAAQNVAQVREWIASGIAEAQHQGFPVVGSDGNVIGIVTRKDLTSAAISPDAIIATLIRRAPLAVQENHSAREAADHMVEADVGRLIVVSNDHSRRIVGIVTRGDLLAAHSRRLRESNNPRRHLSLSLRPYA